MYLGCIFAPMLLFFAISGIWQTDHFRSPALDSLSTIHTGAQLKNGHGLSSPAIRAFIILMAVGFVITSVLGVVMALKYGRSRRAAMACLAAGIIIPVGLVLLRAFR